MKVRSLAYDGSLRREWAAEIVGTSSSRIDLRGVFETTIEHPDLGRIEAGTLSHEYYWTDRWYNLFRFEHPVGELRNYYCNIAMPPILTGSELSYVDLDIDVLIWPGKDPIILDREEFEENSVRLGYPQDVVDGAEDSLKSFLSTIAVNTPSALGYLTTRSE